MKASAIADNTTHLLTKMMELAQEQHKIYANNLANANTPGYIRRDLNFQQQLAKLVSDGDFDQLVHLRGQIIDDTTHAPRLDGNNVNTSHEMNEIMQNGLTHNLLNRAYTSRMRILREAMK